MKLDLYQIDAFTDKTFGGNPACVVPLNDWLPNDILFNITKENAVAETAFFVDKGDKIHLRWFTPEIEMDLCGHATLATAHCLKSILNYPKEEIVFETISGNLTVFLKNDSYFLDFPSRIPKIKELPEIIKESLNIQPKEVYKSRDYLLVYDTEQDIKNIKIKRQIFDQINLDPGGVIVTARGDNSDFVSRFFTPQASILEDPVTGSAHCSLIPFWSRRLGKKELDAIQISDRVGLLKCENKDDRVIIGGKAKTYSIGNLWIE
ncbi:PhzF family phenazine biosynthesis protein [Winogradskyella haliclonae]|uniref:Isomerase n=1 Tax=Winogradskyella haliclonae TaxID=2048558 RepID=A0ABQ2BYP9_9FLAO|nr:PhzF family phenazine biosynthesis protein [Winogradskyella haliclonae]GGI56932.1 isomerase [Winogradskyella haliclonae]